MASGFLRQWFGRGQPARPELVEAIAILNRAAEERPALADSLDRLRSLLPVLYEDVPQPPAVVIDQALASARQANGRPLLDGEHLPLADPAHCRRWIRLCEAMQSHHGGEAAADLASAVRGSRLRPDALIQEVLAGRPEAVAAQAEELGLDGGLVTTLLRLLWFPVFTGIQTALAPLRAGAGWPLGHCPTCGSSPLLAELRGLEQGRFLRCGLCAAAWEFTRLQCPFCGTRDHHALGYFHLAGEETKCRVATCEQCRRYVKTIAMLSELSAPGLLATDAATLHLDLAAAERGYSA